MFRTILLCALAVVPGSSLVALAQSGENASVTTAEQLQTLPGFKVEVVLKADRKKHGSWISMALDDKGRLLLAGQRGQPITRLTIEDGKIIKDEQLRLPVSEAMGMLCAFDSLYVDGSDGKKSGLFRLRSTRHDDTYDSVEMLREWGSGSGEHGAHAIVLGPDKKLYVVCGNFVDLPKDLLPTSPHRNYADDRVLPRAEDGNGFGAGKKPPGGFICRMNPDGKDAELYASGERNTYDIAFNADGELLGFDSDMEWDWGTPWYRPIRLYHAVSGADQGFREGTAKWPEYYPDSMPAVVNVGIGSPTGVVFGAGAKFPAKYQRAMYGLDWSYGRILAFHLQPDGASYTATFENFVAPKSLRADTGKTPLNLTDVVIGRDGAMYFTIGGRNTQSALYRVTYVGDEPTAPVDLHDKDGAEARARRHALEAFQGREDAKAVETAWPYLSDGDRAMRYAARLAIESQPVDQWKSNALDESNPQGAMTALLALARLGNTESQPQIIKALAKFPMSSLSVPLQLDKLRVIEVSISRQGKPSTDVAKAIVDECDPLYPAPSDQIALNRELCQVLLALDAPDAVTKTMKLLAAAPTQEEQVGYVLFLRTIRDGWTPELRRQYFSWWTEDHSKLRHPPQILQWFADVGTPYRDGASFPRFIANFHADAVKTLSPAEEKSLADVLSAYIPPGARQKPEPKPRAFVKNWTMPDLEPSLDAVGSGRSFRRGKEVFEAAQCLACHKFGNEGGATGPDLTAVSSRFARRDILESIILPSKVISEQYANTTLKLANGDVIEGRVVEENADSLVVRPNPLQPDNTTRVNKSQIKFRALSKLSPMPQGLVDSFTKNEILDLIAYLESGGNRNHPDFRRASAARSSAQDAGK